MASSVEFGLDLNVSSFEKKLARLAKGLQDFSNRNRDLAAAVRINVDTSDVNNADKKIEELTRTINEAKAKLGKGISPFGTDDRTRSLFPDTDAFAVESLESYRKELQRTKDQLRTTNTKNLQQDLDLVQKSARKAESAFSGFGRTLRNAGEIALGINLASLSQELISGVVGFFRGGFDLTTQAEDFTAAIRSSFSRLGKETSQQIAESFTQDVLDLAASTPFETQNLFGAGQILAISEDADKLTNSLKNVATVAASVSASGAELEEIAVLYQQGLSKGFLNTEDLNQFNNRGIALANTLAEITGKSVAEVRELASQGRITSDTLRDTIDFYAKVRAPDALSELSQTATGRLSTLRDNIQLTASAFIKVFEPQLKSGIDALIAVFDVLKKATADFGAFISPIVEEVGGALSKAFNGIAAEFRSSNANAGESINIFNVLGTVIRTLADILVFFINIFGQVGKFAARNTILFSTLLSIVGLLGGAILALAFRQRVLAAVQKALIIQQNIALGITKAKVLWYRALAVASAGLSKALRIVRLAQLGLNAAFRANPIGVVITAVGLLGAALYALYENFETVRVVVDTAWFAVKRFGGILLRIVAGPLIAFGEIIDAIRTGNFDNIGKSLLRLVPIVGGVAAEWDEILKGVSDVNAEYDKNAQSLRESQKEADRLKDKYGDVTNEQANLIKAIEDQAAKQKEVNAIPLNKSNAEEELKRLKELEDLQSRAVLQFDTDSRVLDDLEGLISAQRIRTRGFDKSVTRTDGAGGSGRLQREFELDTTFKVDEKAIRDQIADVDKEIQEIALETQREQSDLRREIQFELNPVVNSVQQQRELEDSLRREVEDLDIARTEQRADNQEQLNDRLLKLQEEYNERRKKLDEADNVSPDKRKELELELEENYNKAILQEKELNNELLLALDKRYYAELSGLEAEQDLRRRIAFIRTQDQLEQGYKDILAEVKSVNDEINNLLDEENAPLDRRQQRLDTTFQDRFDELDRNTQKQLDELENSRSELERQRFEGTITEAEEYNKAIATLEETEIKLIERANRIKIKLLLEFNKERARLDQERLNQIRNDAERANQIDQDTVRNIQTGIEAIQEYTNRILQQGNQTVETSALGSALQELSRQFIGVSNSVASLNAAQRNFNVTQEESESKVSSAQAVLSGLQEEQNNLVRSSAEAGFETSFLTNRLAELAEQPTTPENTDEKNRIQKRLDDLNLLIDANKNAGEAITATIADANQNLNVVQDQAAEAISNAKGQRIAAILDLVGSVANAGFEILNSAQQATIRSIDQQLDRQRSVVDGVKNALLQGGDAAKNVSEQQLEAEEEKARQLDTLRKQEVAKQQAFTAFQLAANAAIAIARTFATVPFPANLVAASITAASLIASLIAIRQSASAQVPTAAKGGIIEGGKLKRNGVLTGRRHSNGGILIEAEDGEAIFSRDKTKRFQSLINAINKGDIKSENDLLSPIKINASTPIVATKEKVSRQEVLKEFSQSRITSRLDETNRRLAVLESTLRLKPTGTVIFDEDGVATNVDQVQRRKARRKEKNLLK